MPKINLYISDNKSIMIKSTTFLCLLCFWIITVTTTIAQVIVPDTVVRAHRHLHPSNPNPVWKQTSNGYFKAEFYDDRRVIYVYYKETGEWYETKQEIFEQDLPPPIKRVLQLKFIPKYEFNDATLITSPKGVTHYEIEMERAESELSDELLILRIKKDGTIIGKKTKKDEAE